MKKTLIYIFVIFSFPEIKSQESLYLLKKDTIFITFQSNIKNTNIVKTQTSIKGKDNSKKGVRTIYNFLNSVLLKRKEEFYNYEGNINGSVGASSNCSRCFGLYFIYESTKKVKFDSIFKKSTIYKMFYKSNFNKNIITKKDSLLFDKQIFSQFKTRKTHSTLMFNEKEIENKTIFKFDGSTKKYKELLKLSKEPHYFFVLDERYNEEKYKLIDKKKYGMVKTNYFIFNEVFFPSSNQVYRYLK